MSVNERLFEIQVMIEKFIELDDKKSLKEAHGMIRWKRDVRESVQTEQRKLDDIFYFLNGVLFEKGLVEGWSKPVVKQGDGE